tara:strand:- start:78 stop:407 length:330 start_codon:yes stop_codon:yes gene_type:complete
MMHIGKDTMLLTGTTKKMSKRKRENLKKIKRTLKNGLIIKAPVLRIPTGKSKKLTDVWLTQDYIPELLDIIKKKKLSLKNIKTMDEGHIKITFHDPRHATLFGLHYEKI